MCTAAASFVVPDLRSISELAIAQIPQLMYSKEGSVVVSVIKSRSFFSMVSQVTIAPAGLLSTPVEQSLTFSQLNPAVKVIPVFKIAPNTFLFK